ncbi:biotin synthase-like enzyme [Arthrobacter sp. UYEF21]
MNQIKFAIDRISEAVDINIACSLGMLTQRQVDLLAECGVHRYNHNLETARSYFPDVVTTLSYEERLETCNMVKGAGMELCCGALIGMGETLEQRAELAALEPQEVPLNFLNPRPGTPLENQALMDGKDALRAIAAFRLAMPRTVLRYAGGRELTLGNAVIVGNYLTTLGRPANSGLNLLVGLNMPIKEPQKSL